MTVSQFQIDRAVYLKLCFNFVSFQFKQRVGKGDETKDEVFDEFVNNFNKQQVTMNIINGLGLNTA